MTKKIEVSHTDYLQYTLNALKKFGLLLTSKGRDETFNVMTIGWGTIGIIWSKPMFLVMVRPSRLTYDLIEQTKQFTVNVPNTGMSGAVLFCGKNSGRDVDKFAATGLTAVKSDLVDAPYIKECGLVLECRLIKTVELGLHTMFIREIIDVKADEAILGENGSPDPEKHRPFIWSVGGYGFFGLGEHMGSVGELAKKYME